MAQQSINTGTVANDGTGDSLKVAFDKADDNFDDLYSITTTLTSDLSSLDYSSLSGLPSLGTVASLDVGTAEGEVPVLVTGGVVAFSLLPTGTSSSTVAIGDHIHAIADVTGLQAILDGLQAELDGVEAGLIALNDALEAL